MPGAPRILMRDAGWLRNGFPSCSETSRPWPILNGYERRVPHEFLGHPGRDPCQVRQPGTLAPRCMEVEPLPGHVTCRERATECGCERVSIAPSTRSGLVGAKEVPAGRGGH